MNKPVKRLPLPPLWIRSPKLPQWAICLDPQHRHYGFKMSERHSTGEWWPGAELTHAEIEYSLVPGQTLLTDEQRAMFQALKDRRGG